MQGGAEVRTVCLPLNQLFIRQFRRSPRARLSNKRSSEVDASKLFGIHAAWSKTIDNRPRAASYHSRLRLSLPLSKDYTITRRRQRHEYPSPPTC